MGNLVERDFTSRLMLKGTLEPTVHTTVAARVSGTMLKVLVEEGDSVEAGQLLFTIDERNYRDKYEVASATLEAQKSAVEVARAQVEKAEAGFRKSSLDVERYRRLREKERVSANELEAYELKYDSAKADLSLAKANLSSQEAQVALAEANLSIAKKNLDESPLPPRNRRSSSLAETRSPGVLAGAFTSQARRSRPRQASSGL